MMVIIYTDSGGALTTPSITCMQSGSETLLVNFISSLDCALSLIFKWQDDIALINSVTATRDHGRVTAIVYSRFAMSLRSLEIILPIRLHPISLASTFATIFL
jgi:hypothetical protein